MPEQFPPEGLFATMLFWIVTLPEMLPPGEAAFPLRVLLLIMAVPVLEMPPPWSQG